MSIGLMSLVWPLRQLSPVEKLVLMRVCDRASDAGEHVFPSLARMALEIGIEERSIRRIYRRLEDFGVMAPVAGADPIRRLSREYRVNVDTLKAKATDEGAAIERELHAIKATKAKAARDKRAKAHRGPGSPPRNEDGVGDREVRAWGTGGSERRGPGSPPNHHVEPPCRTILEETHTPAAVAAGERVAGKPDLRLVSEAMPEPVAAGAEIPAAAEPEPASPSKAAKGSTPHPAEVQEAFDGFWVDYPRKVGKAAARRKYAAALKGGASPAEILLGARRYAEKVRTDGTEARFIAHAKTWLHDGRWTDEPEPKAAPKFKNGFASMFTGAAAALDELRQGRDGFGFFDDGSGGETSTPAPAHTGPELDLEAEPATTEGRAA